MVSIGLRQTAVDVQFPYALIRDEKPAGVSGGTFLSGAFRTRDLNTVVEDDDGIVSLATNQITLEDGTYRIYATAPGTTVNAHTARLQNIDDAVIEIEGTSARIQSANWSTTLSIIVGRFTVSGGPKAYEIQHRCGITSLTVGFGFNTGFNTIEVYTIVELWKEV
jgi:hypothetical protein